MTDPGLRTRETPPECACSQKPTLACLLQVLCATENGGHESSSKRGFDKLGSSLTFLLFLPLPLSIIISLLLFPGQDLQYTDGAGLHTELAPQAVSQSSSRCIMYVFVHEVALCLAYMFPKKRTHRSIATADLQLLHKYHKCRVHYRRRVALVWVWKTLTTARCK
jgi:hypothetical protein